MSRMYVEKEIARAPISTMLALAHGLWESWCKTKRVRVETVQREKDMQEDMAEVKE